MATYETLFITSPMLTEEEESTTVAGLAAIVSDGGGDMVSNDRMGRRRLAYPIRKFSDGVYTRFLYDADAAVPKELERRIRIADAVLRSLTVRLDRDEAVAAKKQAIEDAKARAEAAEREREEREAAAAAAAAAPPADSAADAGSDGAAATPSAEAGTAAPATDAPAAPAGDASPSAEPTADKPKTDPTETAD